MATIPPIRGYILPGVYTGGLIYNRNRMKDHTGMTREEFLKDISRRDVDGVCKGYEFWLSHDKIWEVSPSDISVAGFYGPIYDALESDLVSEEFKTFLIFNLELFA